MINRVGDALVGEMDKDGAFAFEVSQALPPVSLISLPMGVFAAIQERTGRGFLDVLNDPMGQLDVAQELIAACRVKVDLPGEFDVTMEQAIKMLVRLPSDMPDPISLNGDGELDPTFATVTPGS